jgi:hypothetical protein
MPSCSANELLASFPSAQLPPGQFNLVKIALLRRWLLSVSPSADVTPSGLIAAGAQFQSLDMKAMKMLELQLLCAISQA